MLLFMLCDYRHAYFDITPVYIFDFDNKTDNNT